MTRQERLEALCDAIWEARLMSGGMEKETDDSDGEGTARADSETSAHAGNIALDHLAALEQAAIDAYLSNVPLPEGWQEDVVPATAFLPAGACHYYDPYGAARVSVGRSGFDVANSMSLSPIPLPVLIRAAVQCHRLREAGRS